MRYLKKFESELDYVEDYLFLLIDNEGNEHFRDGTWIEGEGIFDDEGNQYPAGVTPDGQVFGDSIDGYGVLKLDGVGFVPGLEMAVKRGFNYFEGFPEDDMLRERYDFNKLSDSELEDVKNELIDALDEVKLEILKDVVYDLKTNKIKFLNNFKNIDIQRTLEDLIEEFGEDIVRELNIEALLRKISQIIVLKKRNTRRRIKEEFKSYVKTLGERIKRQLSTFSDDEHFDKIEGEWSILPRKKYESEKYDIQVELLKLQEWVVKNNKKVVIVFEGRDSAGKGSTIKRFVEYLNPKYFRVVALGIPTEEEKNNWFGRYEKHLPKNGEIVFFDRSWYNRAVVEPVMGYCTEEQYVNFMDNVVDWEEDLIKNGTILIKFWFSITKEKQLQRFKIRQESPLKYWKFSPNDAKVVDKFEKIGDFKNEMFQKTSTRLTPWIIVNSNDKKVGRLNAMRYVLDKIDYDNKVPTKANWYPEVINIIK
jgi:polyphosphate kinase